MTPSEHDASADERFERLLLDSAESDELPSNVETAWQRFGGTLNGVSLLAAGREGALAANRAHRWLVAKWLITGAIAGSALTALSLGVSQVRPALTASTPLAASATATVIARIAPAPRVAVVTEPPASARPAAPKRAPRTRQPQSRTETATAPSSTLAAQVAMLDAARAALESRSPNEALRLAERYREAFPNGELAPEAELVAIEALVEQDARARAVQRAERFLARYPGDPHIARVKWLVR